MSESSNLTTDQIGPIHPETRATQQAARRTVAAHAHDPHDAALLLDALGLTEEPA